MAIGTIQGSMYYDVNRDMYVGADHYRRQEEEFRRRQEEEYRRMQNSYYNPAQQQEKLVNPTPKPDLNDPLGFLSKADNKILLTGEAT